MISQEYEAPRLSFCDLISSDEDESNNNKYETSRPSEEDESLIFDFFSPGFSFTAPPPASPPDNIIFCGKQLDPNKISTHGDGESITPQSNFKKKVFHWMRPPSSISSRTKTMFGSSSSSKQKRKNSGTRGIIRSNKGPDQISISSSKGRWWMLMFGSMRVPNEMELADIRTRQERRPPEAKRAFVAMFEDHEKQRSKVGTGRSSAGNGLIRVVRSFSCRGYFSAAAQRLV